MLYELPDNSQDGETRFVDAQVVVLIVLILEKYMKKQKYDVGGDEDDVYADVQGEESMFDVS